MGTGMPIEEAYIPREVSSLQQCAGMCIGMSWLCTCLHIPHVYLRHVMALHMPPLTSRMPLGMAPHTL
jgi:hypothetical protein